MNLIPENTDISAYHSQTLEQMKSKNQVKFEELNDKIFLFI
jgi:hypothetical protein